MLSLHTSLLKLKNKLDNHHPYGYMRMSLSRVLLYVALVLTFPQYEDMQCDIYL